MSYGLLFAAVALALAAWLSAMYSAWRAEQRSPERAITSSTLRWLGEAGARITRRGWYRAEAGVGRCALWMNKKFAMLFFKLFPSARPAFAKKDELAGLTTGPSSRFLRSISKPDSRAL